MTNRSIEVHTDSVNVDLGLKHYISGPMTGYPEFNYPFFRLIKGGLEAAGFEVLSPSDVDGGVPPEGYSPEASYKWYLYQSLELLREAEAIIMLPGWWQSKGARIELDIAMAAGMPAYNLWYVDLQSTRDVAWYDLGVLS